MRAGAATLTLPRLLLWPGGRPRERAEELRMAVLEQPDRLRWPVAALVCLLALLALAAPASAETIRVTSRADQIANDGACTLREAVIAANVDAAVLGCTAGNGDDVIVLGGGTYPLTIAALGDAFDAATGSLDVVDPQGSALAIGSSSGRLDDRRSAIGDRAITARSQPRSSTPSRSRGGDSSASPETPAGRRRRRRRFGARPADDPALAAGPRQPRPLAGGAVYAERPAADHAARPSRDNGPVPIRPPPAAAAAASTPAAATAIAGATIAANTVISPDATGGRRRHPLLRRRSTVTGSILADNTADGGAPAAPASGGTSSGGFNVIENDRADCS